MLPVRGYTRGLIRNQGLDLETEATHPFLQGANLPLLAFMLSASLRQEMHILADFMRRSFRTTKKATGIVFSGQQSSRRCALRPCSISGRGWCCCKPGISWLYRDAFYCTSITRLVMLGSSVCLCEGPARPGPWRCGGISAAFWHRGRKFLDDSTANCY